MKRTDERVGSGLLLVVVVCLLLVFGGGILLGLNIGYILWQVKIP